MLILSASWDAKLYSSWPQICWLFSLPGLRRLTYYVFKLSQEQAVEAHSVLRRLGSHIFLEDQLTDVGDIVILMCRPPFTPQEDSGTHFYFY
jgi:hypothetical protein